MERELEQGKSREVARLLALVETERRYYQDVVALLPAGLLIVSSDLQIVSSNREARRLFGFRDVDPLQGPVRQHLPPEIVNRVSEIAGNGDTVRGLAMLAPGEPTRHLEVNLARIRNWEDDPKHEVLVILREIAAPSTQPVAGSSSTDDATPFADILNSEDAIVWAGEPSGQRFLYVNEKAVELLDHPLEKWLQGEAFWTERFHPLDRSRALAAYQRVLAGGSQETMDYRALTASGSSVWLRETVRALPDADGKPLHLIGTAMDITQRRLLDALYMQQQRSEAMHRLAIRMANEITNQITVIAGYSEEVFQGLESTNPHRADLREIMAATDRLRMVTGHLTQSGHMEPPATEVFDAVEFLKTLEPGLKSALNGSPLELKVFPATVGIRANRAQLETIVSTIIQRVRLDSTAGSRIAVECSPTEIDESLPDRGGLLQPGVYGAITIEYSGKPVPPAIFEALLPSREGEGDLGSQLLQAYRKLRAWGGSLLAEDTSYRLFLPRIGVAVAAPVEAPQTQETVVEQVAQTTSPTVLVVESDAGVATLVQKVLARQKYSVFQAENAEQAVSARQDLGGRVDLVVADPSLPGIVDAFPNIKMLFLVSEEAPVSVAFPPGASFLAKPFTPRVLTAKVQEMLAK